MKSIQGLVVLLAFIGLVFLGCSEKSQLPNEPVNTLEKVITTDYTATITIVGIVDPGTVKIVGQNMIIKDLVALTRYEASSDLVTADLLITINSKFNLYTGEGPTHGKWSSVPDVYPDAMWEGSFTGHRTRTGESSWIENASIVGQGIGGVIDGMKNFTDAIIYTNDIYEQNGFYGTASGVLKSK